MPASRQQIPLGGIVVQRKFFNGLDRDDLEKKLEEHALGGWSPSVSLDNEDADPAYQAKSFNVGFARRVVVARDRVVAWLPWGIVESPED